MLRIGSLDITFSPEQLQRLDQAGAVPLGFPHDFLASDMPRFHVTCPWHNLIEP
ncbi:MAG TPA: hypothetical protein VIT91_11875 [Chthoniobacterales bacterium]